MVDGKHCPTCGRDIVLWAVLSAGLPNRIWCPHCSARLTYVQIWDVLLILLVSLVAVTFGAYFAATALAGHGRSVQLAVFEGMLLGAWAIVELAVVWYLRGNRELVLQRDSYRDSSSEDADSGSAVDRPQK